MIALHLLDIFYNRYISVSTLYDYDTSYDTLVRVVKNKYNDYSVFFHINYGSSSPNSEKLDGPWILVHVYSLFNVKCYQHNYFLNDTSTS